VKQYGICGYLAVGLAFFEPGQSGGPGAASKLDKFVDVGEFKAEESEEVRRYWGSGGWENRELEG
jgi:hypothetical protein